jgi:hypothetical protein
MGFNLHLKESQGCCYPVELLTDKAVQNEAQYLADRGELPCENLVNTLEVCPIIILM